MEKENAIHFFKKNDLYQYQGGMNQQVELAIIFLIAAFALLSLSRKSVFWGLH